MAAATDDSDDEPLSGLSEWEADFKRGAGPPSESSDEDEAEAVLEPEPAVEDDEPLPGLSEWEADFKRGAGPPSESSDEDEAEAVLEPEPAVEDEDDDEAKPEEEPDWPEREAAQMADLIAPEPAAEAAVYAQPSVESLEQLAARARARGLTSSSGAPEPDSGPDSLVGILPSLVHAVVRDYVATNSVGAMLPASELAAKLERRMGMPAGSLVQQHASIATAAPRWLWLEATTDEPEPEPEHEPEPEQEAADASDPTTEGVAGQVADLMEMDELDGYTAPPSTTADAGLAPLLSPEAQDTPPADSAAKEDTKAPLPPLAALALLMGEDNLSREQLTAAMGEFNRLSRRVQSEAATIVQGRGRALIAGRRQRMSAEEAAAAAAERTAAAKRAAAERIAASKAALRAASAQSAVAAVAAVAASPAKATAPAPAAPATSEAAAPSEAAAEWSVHRTAEGKRFFFNKKTGQRQWKRPPELRADGDSAAPPSSSKPSADAPAATAAPSAAAKPPARPAYKPPSRVPTGGVASAGRRVPASAYPPPRASHATTSTPTKPPAAAAVATPPSVAAEKPRAESDAPQPPPPAASTLNERTNPAVGQRARAAVPSAASPATAASPAAAAAAAAKAAAEDAAARYTSLMAAGHAANKRLEFLEARRSFLGAYEAQPSAFAALISAANMAFKLGESSCAQSEYERALALPGLPEKSRLLCVRKLAEVLAAAKESEVVEAAAAQERKKRGFVQDAEGFWTRAAGLEREYQAFTPLDASSARPNARARAVAAAAPNERGSGSDSDGGGGGSDDGDGWDAEPEPEAVPRFVIQPARESRFGTEAKAPQILRDAAAGLAAGLPPPPSTRRRSAPEPAAAAATKVPPRAAPAPEPSVAKARPRTAAAPTRATAQQPRKPPPPAAAATRRAAAAARPVAASAGSDDDEL